MTKKFKLIVVVHEGGLLELCIVAGLSYRIHIHTRTLLFAIDGFRMSTSTLNELASSPTSTTRGRWTDSLNNVSHPHHILFSAAQLVMKTKRCLDGIVKGAPFLAMAYFLVIALVDLLSQDDTAHSRDLQASDPCILPNETDICACTFPRKDNRMVFNPKCTSLGVMIASKCRGDFGRY